MPSQVTIWCFLLRSGWCTVFGQQLERPNTKVHGRNCNEKQLKCRMQSEAGGHSYTWRRVGSCYRTKHPSTTSKRISLGLLCLNHTIHTIFLRFYIFQPTPPRPRKRQSRQLCFLFSTLFIVFFFTMHCVGRGFRRLRLSNGVSKLPTLVMYITHI